MPSSLDQRKRALQRANASRSAMCELKFLLGCQMVTLAQALEDERAISLTIYDLLKAQPKWGPGRTRRLLRRLQIPEMKRCSELTDRQRRVIVEGAEQ